MINANNYSKVIWTRDDFLRDDDINDQWLCNPKWQIRPSIAFVGGYPKVLTCEDYNDGSNEIMIHPSRWKYNLPGSESDQIGHVVVQPITVQCGKAGKYTSEWQMFKQKGNFGGIGTCSHVEFGRLEKYFILRFENENKSISDHSDINRH